MRCSGSGHTAMQGGAAAQKQTDSLGSGGTMVINAVDCNVMYIACR